MTKENLAQICEQNIKDPSLQPRVEGGVFTTYCNIAARRVAQLAGCTDFDAMPNANAMVAMMGGSDDWTTVNGQAASHIAQSGGLVIAGKKYEGHGHVAVVYPADPQMSGSWGHQVPMVANVGKNMGVMRSSQAFPVDMGEPTYYAWKEPVA